MVTLAHLSDPHLGPLPRPAWHQLVSKRAVGYVNWRANRARAFQPEILTGLIAAIHAAKPDHIAVTGDLVNIALPEEEAAARAWLTALGNPAHVTAIPGNHDAYVPGALRRALRSWLPFMSGDDPPSPDAPDFPFVRRRGLLALVGASSARATMPFLATGHISDRQVAAIERALRRLGAEGAFRVLLIHHPPSEPLIHWHQRLVGSKRLRGAIRRAGAELVLHGHTHTGSVNFLEGPGGGQVPVIGVPSASNAPGGKRHPAAAFNLYEIGGRSGAFTCRMRSFGYTIAGQPIKPLGERMLIGEAQTPGTRIQA